MALTPITLSGTLGERHRRLNSLVREAGASGASLQEFQALPEHSPVDRLFKIDLASQLRHVDYIIQNLQDDDMLYVSRALKSKWLVDHHDVVNPKHLEDVLFPNMIKPAVSKLKHWTYINLRDPAMCREFYLYYKDNAFEFAIKFLSHCSNEFILGEIPTILTKLSSQFLKILSEKCPKVAEIYYNSLATDEEVRRRYLENQQSYYNSVKGVLKSDADVFLDITEKYFDMNGFRRLSPSSSDYILRCHKHRFTSKPELYTAYMLHMQTLADRLSVEECQELVMRLARAKYLQSWFQYKAVEPLVKRLSPDKRAAFKKRVFVDKDVGESVDEWPYKVPAPPEHTYPEAHIFDDQDFAPIHWGMAWTVLRRQSVLKPNFIHVDWPETEIKTEFDKLFDEFRFVEFSCALNELGQRLGTAGSPEKRRDIFMVLVSKTGGCSEAVSALLSLAARHRNEPVHIRAAVVRSLVKRAQVWRLPADVWNNLLEFGHDLGLDGSTPEADCKEGLHAVVIRQLLAGECQPAISAAFLKEFSTLTEYSLSPNELLQLAAGLQNLLYAAALVAEPDVAAERLNQLLDVLNTYRVCIKATSPVVGAIVSLASRDAEVARPLLQRLYHAKVARRELLRLNLEFRRDQASLINVLRHDLLALDYKQFGDIITSHKTNFDTLISKLSIYFPKDAFVTQLRIYLKQIFLEKKENIDQIVLANLARSLASLLGRDFETDLQELDTKGTDMRHLTAALRANAHRARPAVAVASWGWRRAGVKAVATRAMRGRQAERAELTRALAAHRRTLRVALANSMLSAREAQVHAFTAATQLRPTAALRALLIYFRRFGDKCEDCIWSIVKPLMFSIKFYRFPYLQQRLRDHYVIPSSIQPDYYSTQYMSGTRLDSRDFLREVARLLPVMRNDLMEQLLVAIITASHPVDDDSLDFMVPIPYPSIFIRYLMLSKSNEEFEYRFEKSGKALLKHLDVLHEGHERFFWELVSQTLKSLTYNEAFFDTKCTSCLSVIEKFMAWMETVIPREEYFKQYARIHLTMLYYKAVRASVQQLPAVFAAARRRRAEAVDAVGFVFGRYIARELAQLVTAYFDSVVELYADALADYVEVTLVAGSSRAQFVVSVLKGILAEGVGTQRRLAVYIFKRRHYEMKEPLQKELEELMYKEKDIEVLVHAELERARFY
ncbi:unnamed protein product [Chrysodeixis includens]|uniref:Uncharacterized protein n=1 Tax=Chrysodeixis includens TaxID=689277 RepID=A0A9P0BW98_CHRIL|nr:unnamed protein product [Chrysodeixis includens]